MPLRQMRRLLALALVPAVLSAVNPVGATSATPAAKAQKMATMVMPIYHQLVAFRAPLTFQVVHSNDNGQSFIQEAIPRGESLDNWSQMITVTGAKGMATQPRATPRLLAEMIAGGYQKACPSTFRATKVNEGKLTGGDAFTVLVGCGEVRSGAKPVSEVALITTIKGEQDMYTVQWSQRGPTTTADKLFEQANWLQRLSALMPIKVCQRIPNEPAPYPSCTGFSTR
ncbi:hypothetical protein NBRC116584_30590 [Hydrogenophaga sp. 5NK40-0174]